MMWRWLTWVQTLGGGCKYSFFSKLRNFEKNILGFIHTRVKLQPTCKFWEEIWTFGDFKPPLLHKCMKSTEILLHFKGRLEIQSSSISAYANIHNVYIQFRFSSIQCYLQSEEELNSVLANWNKNPSSERTEGFFLQTTYWLPQSLFLHGTKSAKRIKRD